ncbi:pseudouridine synthase [Lipomyces orientalis]|uniref:Pseudouridine synthase n=1 Tax=Lipomyces orientalis TaxID=1233043 RepID=A0ACC3TCI0_9ASCO
MAAPPPAKRARLDTADLPTPSMAVESPAGITEPDVGITQYLGAHAGFRGVLKQRYTDFLVNEILPSGEILHVKHVPVQAPPQSLSPKKEQSKKDEEMAEFVPDEDAEGQVKIILGEECILALRGVVKSGGSYESSKAFDDKDERGKIHQLIRVAYKGKIESKTTSEYSFKFTKFAASNSTTRRRDNRGKNQALANLDPVVAENMGSRESFTHFTIHKENKESMDACHIIAKFLRMKPKSVTIAGTKDRRGVTVQRASIAHTPVERLVSLNKAFRDIILSDFRYERERIKLGELRGNEFVITIRDVQPATGESDVESVVNEGLTSLIKSGFINYFGMQRFGTHSVPTHEIGINLLQKRYKEAAQLLLSVQPLVVPESIAAREQYARDPGNINAAMKLMPRYCTAEVSILRGLERSPQDWLGAIMQIPRNLRVMYVHAYQSFVWNTVVSERIAKFGLAVLEGDLVLDDAEKIATHEDAEDEFEEDVMDASGFVKARPITAEEVRAGQFTIFDVVMPSPGFDVEYPARPELRESYERIMAKDGLSPYKMRHNVKEFSLSGAYRHVLAMPGNIEWWCRRYADPLQQMVRTDLDILRVREETGVEPARVLDQEEILIGDKLAVVLKLRIGPSQYATMALREVMKLETSRRGDMFDVKLFGTRDGKLVEAATSTTGKEAVSVLDMRGVEQQATGGA